MMRALIFGAGAAVGYVLGTKAGRQRYEQLKQQVGKVWQDPRTQEKIAGAKESVKDLVPEVKERLHVAGHKAEGAAAGSSSAVPKTEPDVQSDPAHRDTLGSDWSDEGGATPGGPATNTDPRKEPGI
ncbi:hypothetical protein LVY72_01200 [Arthrobacter sp. I2-34]|uniref:YtxH domain-containing protein n=1 Tax=Arthrobacter hankyongi TaxID=2904801 RepID=A0ABS9L1G3_9MICC|nr:YtxH domain-containing protein [Arthrobacter hankyongi]MCG2620524.1 hypothetical protein [Arthrobacter hankyongi]